MLTPAPVLAGGARQGPRTGATQVPDSRAARTRCSYGRDGIDLRMINRYSTIFTPMVGGFGREDGFWENATAFTGNVYYETGDPLQPCAY